MPKTFYFQTLYSRESLLLQSYKKYNFPYIFYFKKIKSKKARNPKTKEEIIIPERLKLIFKPSKKLKFK
ncbi:MAG: HU family DNA-binding protein [Minisyncoccia bacterium]